MAIELKKPKTKKDYENIKWYIFHKNCFVYVDADGEWLLQINTPCEKLDEEGFCTVYDTRPPMCRDYSVRDCFMNKSEMKHIFFTEKDYDKYLKENVNVFKDIKIKLSQNKNQ